MRDLDVSHLIEPASELLGEIITFDLETLCTRLGISYVEGEQLIRVMAGRRMIEPIKTAPDGQNLFAAFLWELNYELAFLFNKVPGPTEAQLGDEKQVWGARMRVFD